LYENLKLTLENACFAPSKELRQNMRFLYKNPGIVTGEGRNKEFPSDGKSAKDILIESTTKICQQ